MLIAFFEAIRFLTLIPLPFVPAKTDEDYERAIARATLWFPLVGFLIGGLGCLVGWAAEWFWDGPAHAVLIVVALGLITSGLHLDGLSDTFDGLMSWRPRERKLEIMKDSRIGAMGAGPHRDLRAQSGVHPRSRHALAARRADLDHAGALGRCPQHLLLPASPRRRLGPPLSSLRPPPRFRFGHCSGDCHSGPGLRDRRRRARLAVGVAAGRHRNGAGVAGHPYLGDALDAALGGLTGDTYGALCEIGEVVALAALSALR